MICRSIASRLPLNCFSIASRLLLVASDCLSIASDDLPLGFFRTQGERSTAALRARAAAVIGAQPLMHLDYLSLASMADGAELEVVGGAVVGADKGVDKGGEGGGVLASIAVRLGTTRLIDNVVLA